MDNAPEFESAEAFAEYLFDEDCDEFTAGELVRLSATCRRTTRFLRAELESYGLRLAHREPARRARGVMSNDNDRWYGPGAERMHGGSGYEQIEGFAGKKG